MQLQYAVFYFYFYFFLVDDHSFFFKFLLNSIEFKQFTIFLFIISIEMDNNFHKYDETQVKWLQTPYDISMSYLYIHKNGKFNI